MKTMTVGEFKTHFSEALDQVKQGETVIISYGRKKEKVAALVPYPQLEPVKPRLIGLLHGQAECRIGKDFSISDEELLES